MSKHISWDLGKVSLREVWRVSGNNPVMNQAMKIFKSLSGKHDTFINVFVDDWRGWRFIFDTEEVRNCNNDCDHCGLFRILKNEKEGESFSARLYPASQADKGFYGKQNFLNCKSIEQYRDCYASYLLKGAKTESDVEIELNKIRNSRIIFSRETADLLKKEDEFRKSILEMVLKQADVYRRDMIARIWSKLSRAT